MYTHVVDLYIDGKHRTAVPNVKKLHDHNRLTFNPAEMHDNNFYDKWLVVIVVTNPDKYTSKICTFRRIINSYYVT